MTIITTLTNAEYKAWLFAWQYHMDTGKQGQDRAAKRAWRSIQREFSRLGEYDGANAPQAQGGGAVA